MVLRKQSAAASLGGLFHRLRTRTTLSHGSPIGEAFDIDRRTIVVFRSGQTRTSGILKRNADNKGDEQGTIGFLPQDRLFQTRSVAIEPLPNHAQTISAVLNSERVLRVIFRIGSYR
jgi:hypothetical protein